MLHYFCASRKSPKTIFLFLSLIFLISNILVTLNAASIKNIFEKDVQNLKEASLIRCKRADNDNKVEYDNFNEKGVSIKDSDVPEDDQSGDNDSGLILDLVLCGVPIRYNM